MGLEPLKNLADEMIPSCPSKYLTAFSKVNVRVAVVCFVLVNEVRLVNILINKYIKIFCCP